MHRSHRSRRLQEGLLLLTPTSLHLEPPTTPLDVPYPFDNLHVAPMGYTYQHQPPQFSLSLPAALSPYLYEACHSLNILLHMLLRLQPAPRQRFSSVASNRRSRPPFTPMRDIFGVQSVAAPSTATAFQTHPSSKGKRKRSIADRVSAVVKAIRNEFSDNDSQESSSATPNDSAQPSDAQHHDDD